MIYSIDLNSFESKNELLSYIKTLDFVPEYMGLNYDALYDVMSSCGKSVTISVTEKKDSDIFETFMEVLSDASEKQSGIELIVSK